MESKCNIDKAYGLTYDCGMNTTTLPQNLTVSQARANLYDLIEEVGSKLRRFVISHKGRPTAVVMPVEDLESWDETLEIMANKKLMRSIKKAKGNMGAVRQLVLRKSRKNWVYETSVFKRYPKTTGKDIPKRG